MSEPVSLLTPYLPRLLLRWISEDPEASHRGLQGSMAFVDLSGFTKLSEHLAGMGNVGAELLTDAIDASFSRLLADADAEGGALIKFGGDALLLFFTGGGHQVRACRAAFAMRRSLRDIGKLEVAGRRIALRMSTGVHSGAFHFFLVGRSHRELIVAGSDASRTVLMESAAAAGEILVSPVTAAALPASALGERKGPGVLLRRQPSAPAAPPPPDVPAVDDSLLLPYVPAAVRAQVTAGALEPEHRRVTVAFLKFSGTDQLLRRHGAREAGQRLEALVSTVQQAVDKRGVAFLGTDIDADGGKMILAAGAPSALGNDEESMLLALREVVDAGSPLPLRVGVNSGSVFAAGIGPANRRTYTVMGDPVNLAARVMASRAGGPGQILATPAVLEPSRTQFDSVALPPFSVKGKSQPVQAYRIGPVVGEKRHAGDSLPLIGRDAEMQVLTAALASAHNGAGRLVEIIAEPGMGKSRLVQELTANAVGMTVREMGCELYESTNPYAPFRRLLRDLLAIPDDADEVAVAARLCDVLAELVPELLRWAPLLSIVLDAALPDTPQTAKLDEQFRRSRLNAAVFTLLEHLLDTPTLLVVEDAHWMDEASADLLGHITARLPEQPWLICVTRRGLDSGFIAPDAAEVSSLALVPLEPEAAAALADAVTAAAPLSEHEMAALTQRSGGNPLFLRELLAAAGSAGGVEGLPDSIEALIAARIDRLPQGDRTVLRHASVLGQTFRRDIAEAVLPGAFGSTAVWDDLGEYLERDGGNVRFRHELIRDVAYRGLSYRRRQQLHAVAGEAIEKAAGDRPDDQAALLSLHFLQSQRFAEAWRYSLAAAESARGAYANVEAARYYQRALEAARRIPDLLPTELARVNEELGDVRDRMGSFNQAATAYGNARRYVTADPVTQARLLLKLSWAQGWLRRYSQALRWITRGLRALDGVDTPAAARQRAQLKVWYARFCQEQGRHALAIRWCGGAITDAEASGEQQALAHAYKVLDWAYMELGQADQAVYSPRALAIYEELGDLSGQASVLNNMGGFAYWQGRWSDALDLYQRASEAWRKTGDEVGVAFARSNVGEILSDQGRLDEAGELFGKALRVWHAAGHQGRWAFVTSNLGRVASRAGRGDEALAMFAEARAKSKDVGAEADVLETDARIAECYVFRGDARTALAGAEQALQRARAPGGGAPPQAPLLHRIRGYALLQLGDVGAARQALEESLEAARTRDAEYEVALTLWALADVARRDAQDVPEQLEAQAQTILDRLQVVALPAVPLPEPVTAG